MSRIVVRNIWRVIRPRPQLYFRFTPEKNINFNKDKISLRSRAVRVKIIRKKYINSTTEEREPLTFNYQISFSLLLHNTVVKKREKDI